MKSLIISLVAVFIIVSGACSRNNNGSPINDNRIKSTDFPITLKIEGGRLDLKRPLKVEEILLNEDNLFVKAKGGNNLIYKYSLEQNEITDSLCPQGEGRDEFIMVTMCRLNNDDILCMDNAQKKWWIYEDSFAIDQGSLEDIIVNDVHDLGFPIIGFIDYTPESIKLKALDIRSQKTIDELEFENIVIENEEINDDFTWDYSSSNNKAVLCFINEDKIIISQINNGNIEESVAFTSPTKQDKIYYTDVVTTKDFFIVLSQRDVDVEDMSGVSQLEFYNYDCQPIKRIILPGIISHFDIDPERNIAILTPEMEDNLIIMNLNSL